MTIFTLSRKNILAKPLHSLMSVLLFALSIGLVTFIMLFNHQLKQGLDQNLAGIDLVIGAKGSPLQLILNSMYHIDAPTGNISLEEAAPFLHSAHPLISQAIPLSLGDSYGAYRIVGAPPSILPLYGAKTIRGNLYIHDFDVVAGSDVADRLDLHLGQEFYSTHGLEDNPDLAHDHGSPFIVKGILTPTGTVLDQILLCTPQTVWKVHEHDTTVASDAHVHTDHQHVHDDTQSRADQIVDIDLTLTQILSDSIMSVLRSHPDQDITSILVRFKNKTSIGALNFLRNINTNTGLMAASPALEINRLYAMMGSGTDALGYLAILISVVAAVSVFISLYTSLRDRQYEIALLRVGGAGPGKIFLMIIFEGMWITLIGLALGMLAGHGGMSLAGNILEQGYKYRFTGAIWTMEEVWIIIVALGVGMLASLLPAIRGSRVNLHQTLAER